MCGGESCANYVHDSVRAEGREGASKQASSAFLSAVALVPHSEKDGATIKGFLYQSSKGKFEKKKTRKRRLEPADWRGDAASLKMEKGE